MRLLALAAVLALPGLAPQDENLGTIQLTLKGEVYDAPEFCLYRKDGSYREAVFVATQQTQGPDTTADLELLVNPVRSDYDKAKKVLALTVPAGTYGLRLTYRPGVYQWLENVKVSPKGSLKQTVELAPPGTLKGSWSIDKSVQTANPSVLLSAVLVRDGKAWAGAIGVRDSKFEIKDVPPGPYTLVLSETFEAFCWFKEDVTIASGKETQVAVDVKREGLGGLHLEFTEGGRKISRQRLRSRVALVDDKGRIACLPGLFSRPGGDADRFAWTGIPQAGKYTLHAWLEGYKPVERKGVQVKAPTLRKVGLNEEEVYPVVTIPLTILKSN